MTMPWGSTEEPMTVMDLPQSVPVHVVSSESKPGKSTAAEFGRWRTVVVSNTVGPYSVTPGAQRLLNRSLRRKRAHIVVTSGSNDTTIIGASGAFTAAGGSVSLPVFFGTQYLTGFDVDSLGNGTAAGTATITVSNVAGGPYTYYLSELVGTATSFSIRYPGLGLLGAGGNPTVTVSAVASGSSGTINLYGTDQIGINQDGVIVGTREEICGGTAATPGLLAGFLPVGINLRWEVQQELWVCYPSTNNNPVYVSVCDEQYASDPEAWKEE